MHTVTEGTLEGDPLPYPSSFPQDVDTVWEESWKGSPRSRRRA